MAYHVAWRLVGPDERVLERDTFPDRFVSHEAAIAFVFDKLAAFPTLGYDRERGFWARGGAAAHGACETRFVIAETARIADVAARP